MMSNNDGGADGDDGENNDDDDDDEEEKSRSNSYLGKQMTACFKLLRNEVLKNNRWKI